MELQYNSVQRLGLAKFICYKGFVISTIVFFYILLLLPGKQNRYLCRGLRYIDVRYIDTLGARKFTRWGTCFGSLLCKLLYSATPSPQTKCWAQTSIGPNRELKPLVPRIPLREGSQYKKSNPIVTEQLENQNCARLLAARTFEA